MVLTSLGLCLCLSALGEGSKVLVFGGAFYPGKLLNSCWLLSREEKGCSPHTHTEFHQLFQSFGYFMGRCHTVREVWDPCRVDEGWRRAAGLGDVAEPFCCPSFRD